MVTDMTPAEYLAEVAESPFWRPCHCPGCPEKFEPVHPTQYHCSAECAATCIARRQVREQ